MDGTETATKVEGREELYRGRVFRLVRERVRLGNGAEVVLDILRHPGAAAIIPLIGEEDILMIKQYRHAVGRFIWEIPAGTLNREESPAGCARRELEEETGFSARCVEKIGEITPVPGYSDERIHIFLATRLEKTRQSLDEDEWLQVERLPLTAVREMVCDGRIVDGKTVCALYFLQQWKQGACQMVR